MKHMIFLLLIAPLISSGQIVYTSPFTESYPTIFTSKVEEINRRITFEPSTVSIATEKERGKEIGVLTVQEVVHNEGPVSIFCTSLSELNSLPE